MIQMWDEKVPNLDVCGLMAGDRQVFGECPCDGCEGIIVEAWERMTYGGWNKREHLASYVEAEVMKDAFSSVLDTLRLDGWNIVTR